MDFDDLQDRCATVLRGVPVPDPFDLDVFCRALSAARGRSIVLVPVYIRRVHEDLCLPWFTAVDTDYVLFGRDNAPRRRVQRALHAVGHLLLEHSGTPMPTERLASQAAPGLDLVRLRRVLGDTVFVAGRWAETEADAFAAFVLHRAGHRIAAADGTGVAGTDGPGPSSTKAG
jgi:hypothetical protein